LIKEENKKQKTLPLEVIDSEMRIKRPTTLTVIITSIVLVLFFAGGIINQDDSTRIYFENKNFTLIPINDTTIKNAMTQTHLKTAEELANKGQSLNNYTIYTKASNQTMVYSYGILDLNSNTVYSYASMRWFGITIDPLIPFALALIAIIITALLCLKYGN
jgi:hypothetical protein